MRNLRCFAPSPCIHGGELSVAFDSLSLLAGFQPVWLHRSLGAMIADNPKMPSQIFSVQNRFCRMDETQHTEFNHGLGNKVNCCLWGCSILGIGAAESRSQDNFI